MGNLTMNCSEELTRFIKTVARETDEDKTDGILDRLLQVIGGEREVYEFIVAEGFNITYDEFLEYYKACQVGVSVINTELSDDELDTVAGGWGISSITKIAKKAGSAASSFAHDTAQYVADNPGAFVAGAGTIGGGAGAAAGAITGAIIGGTTGVGIGAAPAAGIGAAIGGGVGSAVGGAIGIGTVIIANEIVN